MITQKNLKKINSQVFVAYLLGLPGEFILAAGLFSLFYSDAAKLHPILGYSYKTYIMIGIGLIIEVFHLKMLMPLLKKQAEMEEKAQNQSLEADDFKSVNKPLIGRPVKIFALCSFLIVVILIYIGL